MGLSIHYSGVLRDKKLLGPLIKEVKEISETLDWTSQVIDDKNLKGNILCARKKRSRLSYFRSQQPAAFAHEHSC